MPAQSVDPGIDERREEPAVEGDAHRDTGGEGEGELDAVHPEAVEGLTARTYPVGGPGSRCGSDQRAVMPQGCGRQIAVSSWPIGPCPLRWELPLAALHTLQGAHGRLGPPETPQRHQAANQDRTPTASEAQRWTVCSNTRLGRRCNCWFYGCASRTWVRIGYWSSPLVT
jgi:hypothetical protein